MNDDEKEDAEAEATTRHGLELPYWMRTRAGQWLSRHIPFVGRAWTRSMLASLYEEAKGQEARYRLDLLVATNVWFARDWGCVPEADKKPDLIRAWVNWRNAAERLHKEHERIAGQRLELPPWLAGMARAEDLFKEEDARKQQTH